MAWGWDGQRIRAERYAAAHVDAGTLRQGQEAQCESRKSAQLGQCVATPRGCRARLAHAVVVVLGALMCGS